MAKPTYKPINVKLPPGQRPAPISFETKRFKVRSLGLKDASEKYLSWINDPEIMNPLNMPARQLSKNDLQEHIAGFNNRNRFILGMFDKASDDHFGIYLVDVSWRQRLGRIQYFIGDAEYRRLGALRETATGLVSYLFQKRGVEKIAAQVAVDNEPSILALEAIGFSREGEMKGEIRSFKDDKRIDQYFYGVLHDQWKTPAT